MSSIYSLIISQLAIALIGGNAIAGERADRSAEFLCSLPITRKRILASKLLISLAIILVIWLTDTMLLMYLRNGDGHSLIVEAASGESAESLLGLRLDIHRSKAGTTPSPASAPSASTR